jgi:hypothetical protein
VLPPVEPPELDALPPPEAAVEPALAVGLAPGGESALELPQPVSGAPVTSKDRSKNDDFRMGSFGRGRLPVERPTRIRLS